MHGHNEKISFKGKTALLVDDDDDFVFQQNMFLEECGFTVIQAHNVKGAKELIAKENFDIAIVDLIMDEVDAGLTLSYEIKKKNQKLPVIMVTGVSGLTKLHFDKSGNGGGYGKSWLHADSVLSKPIRDEQLLAEIKHHLL